MTRTDLKGPCHADCIGSLDAHRGIDRRCRDRHGQGNHDEGHRPGHVRLLRGPGTAGTRAAAVNPADWAIMRGLPYIARPVYGLRKPKNRVRGTDVAGEVEAVGTSVTRFQPGDEVFGWCQDLGGAFAEYASISEDALTPK